MMHLIDWKKELGCFLTATAVSLYFYFGFVDSGDNTSIFNIHDTYFVIDRLWLLVPIIFFTFYIVYFLRTIWEHFNAVTGNSIFLLFNTLLIIGLLYATVSLHSIIGNTIYPPLSSLGNKSTVQESDEISDISSFLYGVVAVLSLLELFIGYKTYRKIKPAKKPC